MKKIDKAAYQERLDRITAIFKDMMAHATEQARYRCPYKNRFDECTARFGCRNQRKPREDRRAAHVRRGRQTRLPHARGRRKKRPANGQSRGLRPERNTDRVESAAMQEDAALKSSVGTTSATKPGAVETRRGQTRRGRDSPGQVRIRQTCVPAEPSNRPAGR